MAKSWHGGKRFLRAENIEGSAKLGDGLLKRNVEDMKLVYMGGLQNGIRLSRGTIKSASIRMQKSKNPMSDASTVKLVENFNLMSSRHLKRSGGSE